MIRKTKAHTFGSARHMTNEEKALNKKYWGDTNHKRADFTPEQQEMADRFLRALSVETEQQADDDYAVRVKG